MESEGRREDVSVLILVSEAVMRHELEQVLQITITVNKWSLYDIVTSHMRIFSKINMNDNINMLDQGIHIRHHVSYTMNNDEFTTE